MLRRKQIETIKVGPPDDSVEAREDLQYGQRWVPRGMRLKRNDPLVLEAPHLFYVKYALSEEVNQNDGIHEPGSGHKRTTPRGTHRREAGDTK